MGFIIAESGPLLEVGEPVGQQPSSQHQRLERVVATDVGQASVDPVEPAGTPRLVLVHRVRQPDPDAAGDPAAVGVNEVDGRGADGIGGCGDHGRATVRDMDNGAAAQGAINAFMSRMQEYWNRVAVDGQNPLQQAIIIVHSSAPQTIRDSIAASLPEIEGLSNEEDAAYIACAPRAAALECLRVPDPDPAKEKLLALVLVADAVFPFQFDFTADGSSTPTAS